MCIVSCYLGQPIVGWNHLDTDCTAEQYFNMNKKYEQIFTERNNERQRIFISIFS